MTVNRFLEINRRIRGIAEGMQNRRLLELFEDLEGDMELKEGPTNEFVAIVTPMGFDEAEIREFLLEYVGMVVGAMV